MQRVINSGPKSTHLRPESSGGPPDIASASIPATLATLQIDPDIGLAGPEAERRLQSYGYNEVAVQKGHPVLAFLGKFWGLSAWMLELIMALSLTLRKYSDFAVVGALLVVNAVVGFAQERRAAGVVEALRRRLQVSARQARFKLAAYPRPRFGARRHRARALGRSGPRRCKTAHRPYGCR